MKPGPFGAWHIGPRSPPLQIGLAASLRISLFPLTRGVGPPPRFKGLPKEPATGTTCRDSWCSRDGGVKTVVPSDSQLVGSAVGIWVLTRIICIPAVRSEGL